MDNSEDEVDDIEWKSSFVDSASSSPAAASSGNEDQRSIRCQDPDTVILHFDLDFFYAQGEMIRNTALREVPLELLMSYCPLVERLGFDENFMDITEMVERRLAQTMESDSFSFKGHIYSQSSTDVKVSSYPRLALGSHFAAELRKAIHSKLNLIGCAGIATSKLLAKLMSGAFKPNQQTTLSPENVGDILGSLNGLCKVPGVGHQTAKRLHALGLVSVQDLQLCPLHDLMREFGGRSAQCLKNLAVGIIESPVTSSGAPR
ncbi:LOW QUALITY PROTEIN: DNA polymerase iota-like [Pholidichthys leucotaenia]